MPFLDDDEGYGALLAKLCNERSIDEVAVLYAAQAFFHANDFPEGGMESCWMQVRREGRESAISAFPRHRRYIPVPIVSPLLSFFFFLRHRPLSCFLSARVPLVLRTSPPNSQSPQLYDKEIVQEESFVAWREDEAQGAGIAGKGKAKLEVAAFMTWLENADDEEEDDEEED